MVPTGPSAATAAEPPALSGTARVRLAWAIPLILPAALACTGNGTGARRAQAPAAPRIQAFTPQAGVAGETTVTLAGVGFTGFTEVRFGTVAATAATADGDTRLTVQVPAAAVTGPITVVTPRGAHGSAAHFVVVPRPVPPPAVAGFEPAKGVPGATVILTGAGFAGTTQVAFGGTAATEFWERSATTLEARVPAGAVTGPLTVTTAAGSGASGEVFTVLPDPVPHRQGPAVTAFTPIQGAPGTRVVITGDRLEGATQVSFNGLASTLVEPGDDRTLAAYVPQGAGTGPIAVATPGGTGVSAASFTVLAAPVPAVTGFTPGQGAPGDPVTISGTGLAGATEVFFGGVGTTLVGDGTDARLTAVVPDGAASGPVAVLTPGGLVVSEAAFTVLAAGPAPAMPVLAGADPGHGRPGDEVTLTGTGLLGTLQVDFGPAFGAFARQYRIVDDTTVVVRVPPTAATGPIFLATASGLAQWGPFTVDPPVAVPAITGFSPVQGEPGIAVTLQGTGLAGATQVTFGGENAAGLVRNPDGSLTAVVPADALSGPIGVVLPGGFLRTDSDFQVLAAAPPAQAVLVDTRARAGEPVAIQGTGLDQVTGVGFTTDDGQTLYFTDRMPVQTGTRLTVLVPPQAAAGPLVLAYPGGRVAVSGTFTVLPSAPLITGMDPDEGLPGTEVTLTGHDLLRTRAVTFDGAALPGRFTVVSDSEVRVRVPDGAPAGAAGLIGLATPAGTTVFGRPFTVQESRSQALGQVFAAHLELLLMLDFGIARRVDPYGLSLPAAPVFHPRYPSAFQLPAGLTTSRPDHLAPTFTLNLHLPRTFYPVLPDSLRARLQAMRFGPDQVDVLVTSQDNVYNADPGRADYRPDRDEYQFKPQYWLFPDAPAQGGAAGQAWIVAGLFRPDTGQPGPEEDLVLGGAGFDQVRFGTAGLRPDGDGGPMVADTAGLVLGGVDYRTSYGFWTLTAAAGRAAATLHLLVSDPDQLILDDATGLGEAITLDQLVTYLRGRDFGPAEALASLGRPVVAEAAREPLMAPDPARPDRTLATGLDQITLRGDMFTDVTLVVVNGVPLAADRFQVDSQAILRLRVPAGTQGQVQVWTTRGPGDLVVLP